MIWRLFDLWPTAEAAAGADEGAIGNVINVLGLLKRSATVKRFSQEYLSKQVFAFGASSIRHPSPAAILCLCGVGTQEVSSCSAWIYISCNKLNKHRSGPGMFHRCCARWAARKCYP